MRGIKSRWYVRKKKFPFITKYYEDNTIMKQFKGESINIFSATLILTGLGIHHLVPLSLHGYLVPLSNKLYIKTH